METAKLPAAILLDALQNHGVYQAVCSPGSRNTPLLLSIAGREDMQTEVVADERAAAFVALGKAIASGNPVAVVCTSGTALLNYAPAVAEAYYQGVPLIVISADRPVEWIDQDDSQTLRQADALDNFVKGSYDIRSGREDDNYLWYVNRIANEGMMRATSPKRGPVHFNIRFDNPLSQPADERGLQRIEQFDRNIRTGTTVRALVREDINAFAHKAAFRKVLLVAGFLRPDAKLNKAVAKLAAIPNVAIATETISNLHISAEAHAIDSLLSYTDETETDRLRPDIVISIGGALVSRKLKEFLRATPGLIHWDINDSQTLADCFKCLSRRIESNPGDFLNRFATALTHIQTGFKTQVPDFGETWHKLRESALKSAEKYIKKQPWSEMRAFDTILRWIPSNLNLSLSNGTPIRYAQLIDTPIPHAVYCNRGVSGIDGCVSTAIGEALEYPAQTVLITGDMSFAYDIAALGTRLAPASLTVIVINNGGGGIFRFIPTTRDLPEEERERYFCADPKPPIEGLAAAYGWEYHKATNDKELQKALKHVFTGEAPKIIEVVTDGILSAEILHNYFTRRK